MDELTLRDYFAGLVLSSWSVKYGLYENEAGEAARRAYIYADAMCRERKLGLERATLERLNVEITKYTQVPEEETRPSVQSVDQKQGQSMPDTPSNGQTVQRPSMWASLFKGS